MDDETPTAAKINEHLKSSMAAVHGGRAKHETPLLNSRQQELLYKSWQHSQSTGSDSVGARIFKKIFATDPAVARVFDLDGVKIEDLTENPKFQPHADRFTKSLTFIVNNLGSTEKIAQHAQALGARHVQFQSRGFKMTFWDLFAEAMTECAIEWEGGVVSCRDAMDAWRLLVVFFIHEMRIGFEQERRENSVRSIQSNTDYRDSSTPEVVD